jgi:hypothetical protein
VAHTPARHGPLAPPVLDLLQSPEVSLFVAASDAARRPLIARAFGCRVATDGSEAVTWIAAGPSSAVASALGAGGALALTASHVSNYQTVQVKSTDARTAPIAARDYAAVLAYQDGFCRVTTSLGYPEHVMRRMLRARPADMVAIHFTPATVFRQTPGLGAGAAW